MDARTQRQLRREQERELPVLAEEILNLLPKKLIENNDFESLKNKLVKDIQNGNNEKWIGTKFFTVLSVIKDWCDEKKCYIYKIDPAELQRSWNDRECVVLYEIKTGERGVRQWQYSLPTACVSGFYNDDKELIYKSYLFQKKLNELYPNKFTLSNKTEYKNLWNELDKLFEYVEDKITSECFPAWLDGYDEYWNSWEENYSAIGARVIEEFWDKHLLDLMPDDNCGYHGRKWIADGGIMAWLSEKEKKEKERLANWEKELEKN